MNDKYKLILIPRCFEQQETTSHRLHKTKRNTSNDLTPLFREDYLNELRVVPSALRFGINELLIFYVDIS